MRSDTYLKKGKYVFVILTFSDNASVLGSSLCYRNKKVFVFNYLNLTQQLNVQLT